jgi:DNA-binding beta-propeller fold protein YncE
MNPRPADAPQYRQAGDSSKNNESFSITITMKTVYTPSSRSTFRKLLFLLLAATLCATQSIAQDYTYLRTTGEPGTGQGQFDHPAGMTTDRAGNLYVADYMNGRVQVFDSKGNFVRQIGSKGTEPGQLQFPITVEISKNGQHLYIGQLQALDVFTLDGQFVKHVTFDSPNAGFAAGIATDPATGNIFVATAFEIEVYSPDFGQYIRTFGEYGQGNGQFNNTCDLLFDHQGRLLVADRANSRVQVFDANGTFLTAFGTRGEESGQFLSPCGLSIDGSGFIYVSDAHRVQVFDYSDTDGILSYFPVITFGSAGTGDNQFLGIYDVELDWDGTIYISDDQANHLKAYSKLSSAFLNFMNLTKTYGDEDFLITAMTPEMSMGDIEQITDPEFPGQVVLKPSGEDYIVRIIRAGRVWLRATAPDNMYYSRVTADIVLDIKKTTQQITFPELEPRVFGEAPFAIEATSTSGLPITFETSNPLIASISGKTATLKGPGIVTIIAHQDGNENYFAAEPLEQPLVISAITGIGYEEHNSVRVYPIPAQDVVTINAAFTSEITPVTICDAYGRAVRQVTPEVIDAQTRRINVADLAPGLYVFKLNDNKNTTQRIIKN